MEDKKTACVPAFDCYSDPATLGPRWTRWLMSFELFADGKGLIIGDDTEDAVKQRRRALLLHHAGPDTQDIFSTLNNTGDVKDYDAAVAALNRYFVPQVNATFARQTFHKISQNTGETVQQFATRLRRAAKDCNFGGDTDDQIRDAIVSKCTSSYIRRRLLEEGRGLVLARTLELAAQCEQIEGQMAEMSVKEEKAEAAVNRVSQKGGKYQKRGQGKQSADRGKMDKTDKACYRCGHTDHFGKDPKCPARGQQCRKCNGRDHFAKQCKSKGTGKEKVHNIEIEEHDYAFVLSDVNKSERLNMNVGGVSLRMLVDSGATCNVIDEKTWEGLKTGKIKCHSYIPKPERKLFSYSSNQPLPIKGAFTCNVKIGERCEQAEFIVIKGDGEPLLGKELAMKLGVLKIGANISAVRETSQSLQRQYPTVFQGVGKLKTKQVKLHIDPEVTPVAQPLRRIPFNLRAPVEAKIKELLDLDIIEPVDGPTPWVNPVVIVPKANSEIRLCLDMRQANLAITRERYPIPTVDELLHGMNGSVVFSKLDLKWGYHQIELTPESRGITTFAIHNGVYRYKRLIFGVSSASEQYQHEIAAALAGIEGVENISDDVIVHAKDEETHNVRLHAVMRRLEECGLTLNPAKCQFNMDRLIFMGILLSEKGIGPTEERVRAVSEAREPENASEVRSFLGLVSYSSRFIPQFATVSEPLRHLTRKDTPFEFGPEQKQAFEALKEGLAKAGTLAYFNKDAPTKIIADASPVGLGAVLIQTQDGLNVPICYVSRGLTDCERRYSQTEKEALGLVWACERLHPYVYGRQFDLITDHKPLESIYSPRSKPCARIERWVLRLQPYDFRVVHTSGKNNIADPLSRLLGNSALKWKHAHGSDEYVRFVAVSATPRALTTREVEEASAHDEELIEVRKAIASGHFEKCTAYAVVASELCVIGQLVLRGTRIVLPQALRARAISLAHEGHLGIVGTKQHLRSKVWWPGIDRAAERHCRTCHGCQVVARPDAPEPLRPTELPEGPWQDVAIDLLGPLPSGESILVVVDYYSRYYEYDVLKSTVTSKVIDSLESIFSRHGLPVSVRSDMGPQFKSEEFSEYCDSNGIKHVKTTPRWAQANGEVERQNASLMKRIRIAVSDGLDWKRELRKYVTIYRSIDHTTTGKSPAELLFKRKMRGKLPSITAAHAELEVRDRDAEQKGQSKIYADERRHARYSDVKVGDTVLVRQEKTDKLTTPFNATPHKVVSKSGNQVTVETPTGARYKRNTTFVKRYINTQETTTGAEASQDAEDCISNQEIPAQTTEQSKTSFNTTEAHRPSRERRLPLRLADYDIT